MRSSYGEGQEKIILKRSSVTNAVEMAEDGT